MRLLKQTAPFLLCLLAVPAFGQNAQNILPDSFAGWTATSRQPFNSGMQPILNKVSNDQANASTAAAREYGFVSGETVYYAHGPAAPAGQATTQSIAQAAPDMLTATLYRMKDPSGAYGEYSYLRIPEMDQADFTDHSSLKANEALVLVGNLVLDVQGPTARRDAADIKALVSAVAPKAQDGLFPTLPDHLPDDNRVDRSDHYILGPATLDRFFPGGIGYSLGFAYGTEAETAHFRMAGRDATLLLADFPTPQIAQSQLDLLSKKFNINGSLPGSASPPLFAERSQSLLSILAGASSSEQADKLLDQVQSGSVLTWDEPTFQFKEPSINVMIVGAFVGTGVICMITLIASLAFSALRLAVKRMFPNTLFDRSTQMDILQMGLVSKVIKSEDFYTFDGTRIDTSKVDKSLPDRIALRLFK